MDIGAERVFEGAGKGSEGSGEPDRPAWFSEKPGRMAVVPEGPYKSARRTSVESERASLEPGRA